MPIAFFRRVLHSTFMGMIKGLGVTLLYWLIRKEGKEEAQNETLTEDLKNVTMQAQKVIDVQRKEEEIAARPAPDRNAVLDWLQGISDKRKS